MVKGFHPSANLKLEWFIPLYLLFQTKRSVKIKIGWSIDTESHSQSLKITLYIDSFIKWLVYGVWGLQLPEYIIICS